MARVIKAGDGHKPGGRPATRVAVPGEKKVIDRALYRAKQEAEEILARAQEARQAALAEGRRRAARAREEAMARGAAEAFAQAADDALTAFRRRADRYAEAAEDIRALAIEVVRKVLGSEPALSASTVERVLQRGMAQLRARRRLRVQVPASRLARLSRERPNLMAALDREPDLVIERADDVGAGFARVVTEIGGALCAEETALDALAAAVDVVDDPAAPFDEPEETLVLPKAARPRSDTGLEEIEAVESEDAPGTDDDLDLFTDEALGSAARKR